MAAHQLTNKIAFSTWNFIADLNNEIKSNEKEFDSTNEIQFDSINVLYFNEKERNELRLNFNEERSTKQTNNNSIRSHN
ncbi:hypothetical protein BTJ44_03483 [Bacillus mycoides]|nr:hypothetical protein BTJ44_03483 [Bacillus mycoides]